MDNSNPGQQPAGAESQQQPQYPPPQPPVSQPPQPSSQGYAPPQPQFPAQPPYQQPVYQQPVVAPKKSNRNLFLILGGVLLLLVLGCVAFFGIIFVGIMGATQPMTNAGEAFMAALRDGNYSQAYNMCSPSLQSEVVDASGLEAALATTRPSKWSFSSSKVQSNTGQLDGSATLADGRQADLRLVLDKLGNDWKVSGARITPK